MTDTEKEKLDWWASLTREEREHIREYPERYAEIYAVFGPFEVSSEIVTGVEPFKHDRTPDGRMWQYERIPKRET